MAYNTPPTKSVGNPFTAAEWNTYIRDNFAASFPDMASAKGDMPVATGANAIQALPVGANYQIIEALSTEVSGVRWTGNAPAARLYRTTLQSIGDNIDTLITGFSTEYDYGGFISGNTLVVPITGLYLVEVAGYFALSTIANKVRQIGMDVGGAKAWQTTTSDVNNVAIHISLMRVLWMSAAAIIQMRVLQNSGGALAFNDATLKIVKLR